MLLTSDLHGVQKRGCLAGCVDDSVREKINEIWVFIEFIAVLQPALLWLFVDNKAELNYGLVLNPVPSVLTEF